jgi:hypothetical protein
MKNYELRVTNYELRLAEILYLFCLFGSLIVSANAQSINQSSPTPITANEISGRIPARDLGDSRLTTYFYTFEGKQGDVFINVVTTNFNGDIDVFTADNLRPLTKITAYADSPNNETGRVVYLRQPVKLILRIEGRTPNDDAATFQMKFAGSFAPSTAIAETSDAPEVKSNNETDVRVNSVGTIIEIKPKPTPTPKPVVAKVEKTPKPKKPKAVAETKPEAENKSSVVSESNDVKEVTPQETVAETETKPTATPETVVETEPKKDEKPEESPTPTAVVTEETVKKDAETVEKTDAEKKDEVKTEEKKESPIAAKEPEKKKKSNAVKPVPPAALENINLVVMFKDGSKIERPMSEVLKVGVDKGVLTIISKDGAIGRYSILDVEKMTIQ